jgi:hypothetical protein
MKFWHILFVVALLLSKSAVAVSQPVQDGPVGLTWGISASDVRARGIELIDFDKLDYGKSFIATKLERAVADQESALLSFGFNDKLWRVIIISRDFNNDPHGFAVLARYKELANVLSEKYGKPKENHRLGGSIYAESKYFLAGIRGGESSWYSNFDASGLFVQVGITANDSSTGRWRIFYENKTLRTEFEAAKRSREKGSL